MVRRWTPDAGVPALGYREPVHSPVSPQPATARQADPSWRRLRLASVTVVVGAVLLAGCVAPSVQTTLEEDPAAPSDAPIEEGGIEAFYGQDVLWSDCGAVQCATVQAPLDWDEPTAGAIDLALQRSPATGAAEQRIGSLLVNPGGPGSSGLEFLDYAVAEVISAEVLAAYDVVAFDPRGVGASSAVVCGDDALVDEFIAGDLAIESQEDVEAARETAGALGEACLEATGPLLGEVDTVSAARDMDLLRAVLGDDELYFAGFSYGTFLGATYAGLFQDRVGRLLLDGAMDPAMTRDELVLGQAVGFEEALRAYVEDCQAGADCPLTGGVEQGMRQVFDLIERASARPIEAGDGRLLNGTLAFYGVVVTLYDDASWSYLTLALNEAIRENTGATLLELANLYLDRTPEGTYLTNGMMAFTAINCLDYPNELRQYEDMVAFAEEVAAVAPTFGRDFAMAIGCEAWPFQSTVEREPITAPGADPILVVGTTGDPATPYEWSVALANQLESGRLLTYDGEGHTAYGRSNECVQDAVDAYLLQGAVPDEGLVC